MSKFLVSFVTFCPTDKKTLTMKFIFCVGETEKCMMQIIYLLLGSQCLCLYICRLF